MDHIEADAPPARRRGPWLGIACLVALLAIGIGWWWHAEDPLNPYRDGTTHAATLTHIDPTCANSWVTSLDHEHYNWQILGTVSASFGTGPISGRVHIIRQRSRDWRQPSATFTGGGATIQLAGGRDPYFFDGVCSIP